MDDDEDEREFSKSIVYGFFEQAEATFGKMDDSLYVDASFVSRTDAPFLPPGIWSRENLPHRLHILTSRLSIICPCPLHCHLREVPPLIPN